MITCTRGTPYRSLGCRGFRILETNYSLPVWVTIRDFRVVPPAKDQLHFFSSWSQAISFSPLDSSASRYAELSLKFCSLLSTLLSPSDAGTELGNIDQTDATDFWLQKLTRPPSPLHLIRQPSPLRPSPVPCCPGVLLPWLPWWPVLGAQHHTSQCIQLLPVADARCGIRGG